MSIKRNNSSSVMLDSDFWSNIEHLRRTLSFLEEKQKICRATATGGSEEINVFTFHERNTFHLYNYDNVPRISNSFDLLKRIEAILEECVKQKSPKEMPTLCVPNRKTWKNTSFDKDHGIQMNSNPVPVVMKRHNGPTRAKKFGLTLHLLAKVHSLIKTNKYCTKRELYYQDIKLYSSQTIVDTILDDIACMLGVQKIQLHVLTTSKGHIAGHLYFKDADGNYIDCTSTTQGLMLPNDISGISNIYSEARFILVVEKDSVFQLLLERNIMKRLYPCIIITGKGFPDTNTRQMLRKLWDTLEIPVLALVDGDPYGIEILCIYTYGSKALSFDVKNLAVPVTRWLGIFPSDIEKLKLPESAVQELTANDNKRAKCLLSRPYMQYREGWHEQVQLLLSSQKKVEIEGLCKINTHFLTDTYLPNKIKYGSWI